MAGHLMPACWSIISFEDRCINSRNDKKFEITQISSQANVIHQLRLQRQNSGHTIIVHPAIQHLECNCRQVACAGSTARWCSAWRESGVSSLIQKLKTTPQMFDRAWLRFHTPD
jgi:hypothetical protein